MPETSSDLLKLVLAQGALPSLSPVALRLMEMAADAEANPNALADLIRLDAGMASRLLRLVNSPAYRPGPGEIANLSHAVNLIGFEEIRFMALSMGLRQTLPNQAGGPDYRLFWNTSLHRALLGRLLAHELGLESPEEAFAASLVLEIGLPLLLRALTPEQTEGFPGFHHSLDDQLTWERQTLGLDHRQVGRQVIQAWGLPGIFAQCQGLDDLGSPETPACVKVVDLARRGAESFFAPGVELTDVHELARERFGLDTDAVNRLLMDSLTQAGKVAEAMDIELDQQADMLAVMRKSSEALDRMKAALAAKLRVILADPAERAGARVQTLLLTVGSMVESMADLAGRMALHDRDQGPLSQEAQAFADQARQVRLLLQRIADLIKQ